MTYMNKYSKKKYTYKLHCTLFRDFLIPTNTALYTDIHIYF